MAHFDYPNGSGESRRTTSASYHDNMFTTLHGGVGVIKRNYKIILTIQQQHLDPDTEPTKCVKCSQLSKTKKKKAKKYGKTKMVWNGMAYPWHFTFMVMWVQLHMYVDYIGYIYIYVQIMG